MPKFQLKNEKGLSANIILRFIITEYALGFLKKQALKPSTETAAKFSQDERAKILKCLETIETFPRDVEYVDLRLNDEKDLAKKKRTKNWAKNGYITDNVKSYCLPVTSGFSSVSEIDGSWRKTVTDFHQFQKYLDLATGFENQSLLKRFASFHEVSFGATTLASSQKIQEKINKKELIIFEVNPEAQFGQSNTSCMIFIKDKSGGGYMGNSWEKVSLAAARVFESRGAAERTLRAKKLQGSAVIVRAKIQIEEIYHDPNFKGDISRLNASIAVLEREALLKALDGATIDELKARLAKYEDVSPLDRAPAKKRAM